MATETDRNNRGIQATTIAHGDHKHAEGAIPYNEAVAPGGLLGQPTMGKSRDQPPVGSLSEDFGTHGQAANPFRSGGEKELLGQGTADEGIKDDEYPNISPVSPAPRTWGRRATPSTGTRSASIATRSFRRTRCRRRSPTASKTSCP